MNQTSQVVVVGVRFSRIGKNYYFNASHLPDIHIGDQIIVETSRGWQIGEVTEIKNEISPELKQNIKKVDRKATAADLVKKQELAIKEEEIAAEFMGTDIAKLKVVAFVLSTFLAGIAGSLFAHLEG